MCYIFVFESMCIYRSFAFCTQYDASCDWSPPWYGVPRTPGNGRCRPESCAFREISKFAQRSPQVWRHLSSEKSPSSCLACIASFWGACTTLLNGDCSSPLWDSLFILRWEIVWDCVLLCFDICFLAGWKYYQWYPAKTIWQRYMKAMKHIWRTLRTPHILNIYIYIFTDIYIYIFR